MLRKEYEGRSDIDVVNWQKEYAGSRGHGRCNYLKEKRSIQRAFALHVVSSPRFHGITHCSFCQLNNINIKWLNVLCCLWAQQTRFPLSLGNVYLKSDQVFGNWISVLLSYQLLRIQLVRGPGWNNLLHYKSPIGNNLPCTKCCNQNDNPATGQRQRKATQLCPDDIFQLYDLS